MSKALQNLRESLFSTGLIQPLDGSAKGGNLSVLCRQVQGQEKGWLKLVERLLQEEMKPQVTPFELHLCRRYKLAQDGQLAFGWSISITSQNAKALETVVDTVLKPVLREAKPDLTPVAPAPTLNYPPGVRAPVPPAPSVNAPKLRVVERRVDEVTGQKVVVTEMPLPHVQRDLNVPNDKGRGASRVGKAPTMRR